MWVMRTIRIPYYLGQPRNEIKGNRSVGKSRKVNLSILYRNELGPEKQTITQELYDLKLPGDQVWTNYETYVKKSYEIKCFHIYILFRLALYVLCNLLCLVWVATYYLWHLFWLLCWLYVFFLFVKSLSKMESCFGLLFFKHLRIEMFTLLLSFVYN